MIINCQCKNCVYVRRNKNSLGVCRLAQLQCKRNEKNSKVYMFLVFASFSTALFVIPALKYMGYIG